MYSLDLQEAGFDNEAERQHSEEAAKFAADWLRETADRRDDPSVAEAPSALAA